MGRVSDSEEAEQALAAAGQLHPSVQAEARYPLKAWWNSPCKL